MRVASPRESDGQVARSRALDGAGEPSSVDRLAAATRRLARTIAATEQLAQERAELLRTMDATYGRASGHANGHGNGAGFILLTDAARQSGRNQEVLRRWCANGRLPAVRIGRSWAISRDTLTTLLDHAERSRPRFGREAESG
jgi:hypothetical protein